jgi:hypothetical protein
MRLLLYCVTVTLCVFFPGEISPNFDLKNMILTCTKGFLMKKWHKFRQISKKNNSKFTGYCLQFNVCLGIESPLDERWIMVMEERLSSGIGSMPQIWPGQPCS